MGAKAKSTKTSVRLAKRGDIVRTQQGGEEVVRGVQVVVQLSNGSTETYDASDTLIVMPPEELPGLEEE